MNLDSFFSTPLFRIGDFVVTAQIILIVFAAAGLSFLAAKLADRLIHKRIEERYGEEPARGVGIALQLAVWTLGVIVGSVLIEIEMRQLASALRFELFQLGGEPITPRSIILFVLTLAVTRYVARLAGRLRGYRVFQQVEPGPRYTIVRLIQYVIWVIGAIIGLHIININLTALAVVAGALGLGIGFGLQNIVANFVAGLVLLFEQPIRVNDFVSNGDVEGRVEEIRFRSTVIQTNDNISFIVPNSELTSQALVNWSHNDSIVRVHCPVGVAYGSDIDLVTETLLQVAAEDEAVLKSPASHVWFTEFGDSSLNFVLLVWTDQPVGHRRLRSRINYSIDRAFRRANIQIPFPQRDLHVRSGLDGLMRQSRTDSGVS